MANQYVFSYGNHKLHLSKGPNIVAIKNPTSKLNNTGRYIPAIKIGDYEIVDINNSNFEIKENNSPVANGDIYIKFKKETSNDICNTVLQKYNLQIKKARTENDFTVRTIDIPNINKLVTDLKNESDVL